MSSTLNTKPATAASWAVTFVVSTAAFTSVCSASMISRTANANRPPRARPRSSAGPGGRRPGAGVRLRNASGTTISEHSGAAAMPSATAVWPSAMPTATARANISRDVDSRKTSPP